MFINWTYTDVILDGFIEPANLLYNDINGIMKFRNMAEKVGITDELYSKITAIFIFQNSQEGVVSLDLRYLFANRKAVMLPNPFILNSPSRIEDFYEVVRMRKNDFAYNGMPLLYYDADRNYSYITKPALEIVGNNLL